MPVIQQSIPVNTYSARGFQGTPYQQLDRAQEIAGSTIIHGNTAGYMIGSSFAIVIPPNPIPLYHVVNDFSIAVNGVGLTYAGGNVTGGVVNMIRVLVPGAFNINGAIVGTALVTIAGLSINVAQNQALFSGLRTGNVDALKIFFDTQNFDYLGSAGDDTFVGASQRVNVETGAGGSDTLTGGQQGDIIFGDLPAIATGSGTTAATAFDLTAQAALWTTAAIETIENSTTVPHATAVFRAGEAGIPAAWYKITVVAGARLTVDIDYGEDWIGNFEDTDTMVRIFQADGTTALKTATSGELFEGPVLSFDTDDARLTHTFAQAGTYYIRVTDESGSFPKDSGFVMNVSLTGQAAAALPTEGNDILRGDGGDDVIHGMGGNDELSGDMGDDHLFGGAGNDTLSGGEGGDRLFGGTGNDFIEGGAGSDWLYSGGGLDELFGGPDTDMLFLENSLAGSVFDGGAGQDYLMLTGGNTYYDLRGMTIRNVEAIVMEGVGGLLLLEGGGGQLPGLDIGALKLRTQDMTVRLSATQINEMLYGQVIGTVPNTLFWKGISDTFDVTMGTAKVLSLQLFQFMHFDSPGDRIVIRGDNDGENIFGSNQNDVIFASGGNDVIAGGDGNDYLDGGSGADRMRGGLGNDRYIVDNASDWVDETNGGGTDMVYASINFSLAGARVLGVVEDLTLTGAARTGTGNVKPNTIVGNALANTIAGGAGNDKLYGQGGNDRLSGDGGKDTLSGGAGADVLIGGSSGDRLIGGDGRDTASYAPSAKGVTANLKNPGKNKGDAKGDTYSSVENLVGTDRADKLTGDDAANSLDGGRGADVLSGGGGGDTLKGRGGADVSLGGSGADIFMFYAVTDSTVSKAGRDRIEDFSRRQKDVIDLSAIDAKSASKASNQKFTFIGKSKFSGEAGELRFDKGSKKTFVYGDVTGDGKADFAIELTGSHDLKKADFVL